ncbi:MAG: tetratricopeptide repeat protein, partial [Planctomycetota bacterium]
MRVFRSLPPFLCLFGAVWAVPACRALPEGTAPELIEGGRARLEKGDHSRALRYFEAVEARHPGAAEVEEALYLRAETRRRQGKGSAAFEAYKAFVERFPTSRFGLGAAEGEFAL